MTATRDTVRGVRRLDELLSGMVADGALGERAARHVAAVVDDSRKVVPGAVFVAVAGVQADGRRYVADAVARGAIAVVGTGLAPTPPALMVEVPDARQALARLALRWHGLAHDGTGGLRLAAVTGTNGKSTTAFMVRAIMNAAGWRCGLFGTVYYDLCGRNVPATMTTPGALELASHLRTCVDAGAQAAVLEVSSHALDQHRTDGLRFAAAAFTNLTGDHLDYHKTFEHYRDAKARLFTGLERDAVAVVNRDDPQHEFMVQNTPARVVTYSVDHDADLRGIITRSTTQGTYYRMRMEGRELVLENALVGRHNVYNALAAAGLARALGAPPEAIAAGLASLRNVPGRLQRVPCASAADVFVDYAHTDDALRNVLSVLRPLTRGRLIVVFGCGGDRDRTKRPRMAQAVAEHADAILVTSDNPRTEDPQAIIAEIVAGFDEAARRRVVVEPERGPAIRAALAAATAGDTVLIAGKGHENYQIMGTQRVHFDDVEVAIQAAAELHAPVAGEA